MSATEGHAARPSRVELRRQRVNAWVGGVPEAPSTVEESVYCSCRCASKPGDDRPLCDCPSRYSCVEVFGGDIVNGDESRSGGYCVKDDTGP